MEHVKSAMPIMLTIISKKKHGKVIEKIEKLLCVGVRSAPALNPAQLNADSRGS